MLNCYWFFHTHPISTSHSHPHTLIFTLVSFSDSLLILLHIHISLLSIPSLRLAYMDILHLDHSLYLYPSLFRPMTIINVWTQPLSSRRSPLPHFESGPTCRCEGERERERDRDPPRPPAARGDRGGEVLSHFPVSLSLSKSLNVELRERGFFSPARGIQRTHSILLKGSIRGFLKQGIRFFGGGESVWRSPWRSWRRRMGRRTILRKRRTMSSSTARILPLFVRFFFDWTFFGR